MITLIYLRALTILTLVVMLNVRSTRRIAITYGANFTLSGDTRNLCRVTRYCVIGRFYKIFDLSKMADSNRCKVTSLYEEICLKLRRMIGLCKLRGTFSLRSKVRNRCRGKTSKICRICKDVYCSFTTCCVHKWNELYVSLNLSLIRSNVVTKMVLLLPRRLPLLLSQQC